MRRALCAASFVTASALGSAATSIATPALVGPLRLTLSPRALDGAARVLHIDVGVPAAVFASRVRVALRRVVCCVL